MPEAPAAVDRIQDFKNPPKLTDTRADASAVDACTRVGELLVKENIPLRPRQKVRIRRDLRFTRPRELRPHQSVRLALAEHEHGYRGRLLNHQLDAVAVNAVLDAFEWSRDGP